MQWMVTKMVRWDGHGTSFVELGAGGVSSINPKRERGGGLMAEKKWAFGGKYNKEQFSACCRPWSTCQHWDARAQKWLFQAPGFPLGRSAPAWMDWGTRASIFKWTWLNVDRDVNPGLSVFSMLDFGTGTLCRCTQSCLYLTQLDPTLIPCGVDRNGWKITSHLPIEEKAGWKQDGYKCWADKVQYQSYMRVCNEQGRRFKRSPFPHQPQTQSWNTGLGAGNG